MTLITARRSLQRIGLPKAIIQPHSSTSGHGRSNTVAGDPPRFNVLPLRLQAHDRITRSLAARGAYTPLCPPPGQALRQGSVPGLPKIQLRPGLGKCHWGKSGLFIALQLRCTAHCASDFQVSASTAENRSLPNAPRLRLLPVVLLGPSGRSLSAPARSPFAAWTRVQRSRSWAGLGA